ncbi:rod-binding protein [bacterium]|nr:rod-binding protein [bacterium]
MQIEGFTPGSLAQAATSSAPSAAQDETKLREACQQLESVFLNQMLAQMRKCAGGEEGGLMGGGQGEQMFSGMLDQERAKAWSENGGVGLASILFEQMKGQQL